MNIQDHTKPTTHSGVVHTCHRCGWPFPNAHPSPKHRRAHKKICGTIEGYTKLIHSEPVSDEEQHHSDDEEDTEKTPSPKIEKKMLKEGGSGGGIEERSNRSEDDLFSDAVTEFSDSGISPGTTELLGSPIVVRKEDEVLAVFETPDKTKEKYIKIKLPESDAKASDPLVEDRDGSHNDKFIGLVDPSDPANTVDISISHVKNEKGEEAVYVLSVPSDIPLVDHSETLIRGFKDHETIYSNVPLVLDANGDNGTESQTSENGEPSVKSTEVKVTEGQPLETTKTVRKSIDNLIEAEVYPEVGKERESDGDHSKDRGSDGISHRSEEAEHVANTSGVVSEGVVEEGNSKLLTSQDCGVDASVGSSSRNSLEGNWGSVSVLSTASIDAENTHSVDKSGIGTDKNKSYLGKSDVFEVLPLVELEEEIVEQKPSEIKPVAMKNSEQPPSVTNVINEPEGRKRNEEAIAKVKNWSTDKTTTNPKQLPTRIQKDEVVEKTNKPGKSNLTSETPLQNRELSPPKYIGEGKKVRKKAKGRVSWVPFACCSSVNVN